LRGLATKDQHRQQVPHESALPSSRATRCSTS
jgi:hypothetical protein